MSEELTWKIREYPSMGGGGGLGYTIGYKHQITKLEKRIAELESDYETILSEYISLNNEKNKLEDQVVKLKSSQEWHDASDPPTTPKKVQIQHKIQGEVFTDHGFYSDDMYVSHEKGIGWLDAVRWRDLPTIPEDI